MKESTLPALLQKFFTERLMAQMEASPNTIAGYIRDPVRESDRDRVRHQVGERERAAQILA